MAAPPAAAILLRSLSLDKPRIDSVAVDCSGSDDSFKVQVIRRPRDGTLTSLDFGPVGGRDIAFTPARESLWQWGRKRLSKAQPSPKGTPGEVREMPVGAA